MLEVQKFNNNQFNLDFVSTLLNFYITEYQNRVKSISETMIEIMSLETKKVGLNKYLYPIDDKIILDNAIIMI